MEKLSMHIFNRTLRNVKHNIGNGYVCEEEKCLSLDNQYTKDILKRETALKWVKEKGEDIANVILNDFKSKYIVTSKDYPQLNIILNNNTRFTKIIDSDNNYFVYKISTPSNAK